MSSTKQVSPSARVEVPRLRREVLDYFRATPEPQCVVSIADALDQDLLGGIYFHLDVLREAGEIELHHAEGSREFYVLAGGEQL